LIQVWRGYDLGTHIPVAQVIHKNHHDIDQIFRVWSWLNVLQSSLALCRAEIPAVPVADFSQTKAQRC
jgi:hypothetical protein